MKIRKSYVLFVNPMLGTAYYGGGKFDARISQATLGDIFDCTFVELKDNIKLLIKRGYTVSKRTY